MMFGRVIKWNMEYNKSRIVTGDKNIWKQHRRDLQEYSL